ncbi:hypothetical protein F4803DRAFT_512077 [Xylaria telfairii]|nr:hypothetical protein F4803DRAFT_512077 [Xylaria telfairii]
MSTTMDSQDTKSQAPDEVAMQGLMDPLSPISSPEVGSSEYQSSEETYSDSSGDEGPQNSTTLGRRVAQAFGGDTMGIVSEEDSIFNLFDGDVDDEGCDGIYGELNLPWDYSEYERMRYVSPVPWETDKSISDGAYIPSSGDEGDEDEQNYAGEEYAEGEWEDYYEEDGEYYEEDEDYYEEDEEYYEEGEEYYEEEEEYYEEEEEYYEDEEYTEDAKDAEDEVKSLKPKDPESKDPKSKAAHDSRTPFTRMQENDLPSKLFALNQAYERAQWRVIELQEIHHNVKKELAEAEEKENSLRKELDEKCERFYLKVEKLGISRKLRDEYEAFCESMEPEFGSASGWSITCDEKHRGSYVGYDPEFALFKEHSELPWDQYNFRCEPGVQTDGETEESVVEFWPVAYPSITVEDTATWGDVYPALYDLAMKAARDGSEAAVDMMVALPDREASCKGGWLFEYYTRHPESCKKSGFSVSYEGLTWKQDPVQSRRWYYRSAHKIDSPEDAATKKKRIQLSLKPAE